MRNGIISGQVFPKRYHHSATLSSNVNSNVANILIVGGIDNSTQASIVYSDVWLLSMTSNSTGTLDINIILYIQGTWSQVDTGGASFPAMFGHSSVYDLSNSLLYISGGSDSIAIFSSIWVLNSACKYYCLYIFNICSYLERIVGEWFCGLLPHV